jgi:hypothetical protein
VETRDLTQIWHMVHRHLGRYEAGSHVFDLLEMLDERERLVEPME